MKAYLKVTPDFGLIPCDEETVKYIYNRKAGEVISCTIKRVRNYENLKRMMKFFKITFDMQEHYTSVEAYRYWLVMKAGYFDAIVTPNGSTIFKAHSLSFEDMDEDKFKEVFSACIDTFLKELGRGQSENDILQVLDFA